MARAIEQLRGMIETVARALGNDLLSEVVLSPPYFVATKLEAYKGRGNDDPLASHDMEDILNIIDGRPELIDEINNADQDVREFITEEISLLLEHEMIDYAIQGVVLGDTGRVDIVFDRLKAIKELKGSA